MLYQRLTGLASEMISLYEKKDFEAYQKSAAEFERLRNEFNRAEQEVSDLVGKM